MPTRFSDSRHDMSPTAPHIDQASACIDAGCGIGLVVVDSSRRGIDAAGVRRPHPKHVAAIAAAFAARS
jgi:hypothetical protein